MSIRALTERLVSTKVVGVPLSCALGWLGDAHRRGRVLERCGYLPSVVNVRSPRRFGQPEFKLSSAKGTDQIAWRLWTEGWSGFERPMLDLFAAAVGRSQTVVDVGANGGLYSVLAASVSPDVTVHAFEPLPQALDVLCENVRLNEVQTRVHVMPFAVADVNGEAQLFIPAGNNGVLEMSASLNGHFRSCHENVITVPVMTIDHFAQTRAVERIDVLKVDVESQEHRVLAGARHVLSVHRPVVFLEVLADADLAELDAIRRHHGYDVFRLAPDQIVEAEFISHDASCPNQLLAPAEKRRHVHAIAAAAGLRAVYLTRAPEPDQGAVSLSTSSV